jgi:Mrp family chromosome partitioning ATPase
VTDAAVLSTLVDGTVLVARAFKTQRELARHGARSLLDVGGKTAGIVLNAVDLDRSEYRYYHYYSYKKGGYYSRHESLGGQGPEDSASAPQ